MRRLALHTLALALAVLATAAPSSAEEVRIGIGAPLSGPDALFGTQIRLGVEQAVADGNTSGGFLGELARPVPRDDGGDPKTGASVAKSFVGDKIRFVVGHFSSAVTVPASTVYAEAGVLDITPSAIAPLVTERGLQTIFRTCGREDQQAIVAAHYLDRHFGRIAIVHDRTGPGKALADAVRKSLASDNKKEVFYGSLEKGTHDFPGLVSRLRASGAQVVFWGGTQTEGGLLVHQLRDANVHIAFMGGPAIASDEFAGLAGPTAEGTLMVFPRDPRTRTSAAGLLRRLMDRGLEPDGYTFYAYAAVQVIQQAAAAAKSLEPAALAATMHSGMTFRTVLGDLAFDAKGDPKSSDLTVYVWHRSPTGHMAFDEETNAEVAPRL